MSIRGRLLAALAAALALLGPVVAHAQDSPLPPPPPEETSRPDRLVMVGLGPRVGPSFPGSTRAKLAPYTVFNIWNEAKPLPLQTPDEYKSLTLLGSRNELAFGLAGGFAPRRDREAATQGLREVGFGVEAGVFAEGYFAPQLRLRGELRHGIGGHEALNGDVALDYVYRSPGNDRLLVTLGPRARFTSGKYNRRFFGIDAAEAAASGLPQYRPNAGLTALGVTAGAHYPLGKRWGLAGFAGYERLLGEAAASPLVRQRGSRHQLSAGLALTYVFKIDR